MDIFVLVSLVLIGTITNRIFFTFLGACVFVIDAFKIGAEINSAFNSGLFPFILPSSLLLVVYSFSDTPLAGKQLPVNAPQSHDESGNVVLLDPPSLDLTLPPRGVCRADADLTTRRPSVARSRTGEPSSSFTAVVVRSPRSWHITGTAW